MYEKHFGLRQRPFRAKATGASVFVGPQTATVMAAMKKALAAQDSVVTVAGPAGSGKTTIVGKALQVMAGTHLAIRLGRIQLDSDDVMEFLLEELGVEQIPAGAIRRFGVFRRRLAELETSGQRIVVVVEDALRAGIDTLAEIEALTAADGGVGEGAGIVLMGNSQLGDLMQDPALERLRQRTRGRVEVGPLSAAEMRGYLMHCFRLAGNDFEQIFEADAAVSLHGLTDGIPRVANQVVEAALVAAANKNIDRVSTRFLEETALNDFGLRPVAPRGPLPAPERPTEAPAADEPEEAIAAPAPDDDIPDLIQDTLPDLSVLSGEFDQPEFTAEALPEPEAEPRHVPGTSFDIEHKSRMTLAVEAEPESAKAAESRDIPDWDRDPTCAELMPDLEALERAMAVARDTDEDDDGDEAQPPTLTAAVPAKPRPSVAEPEDIPEITLDNAIRERIQNKLIDEPGQISPVREESPAESHEPAEEIRIPPRQNQKADAELERIASQLAKAKTIEDVDDKLAETLFGEEISFIAAQVVARHAEAASANDENQVAAGEPVGVSQGDRVELSLEPDEPTARQNGSGTSTSRRPATVEAPQTVEPQTQAASPPEDEPPDSIEDQITSMTQTLKALNVKPPISSRTRADANFDDDDEPKSGFFSRFRRS